MKIKMLSRVANQPTFAFIVLMLAGALNARADYTNTVLNDSPVAYYPLGVGYDSGTVATDLCGNTNNGTYVNTFPGFNDVPGPSPFITNGINFDGLSSYVDLSTGNNPGVLNFGGPITMEAWVQPSNPGQNLGDILAKGYDSGNNDNEVALRLNSSRYEGVTFSDSRGTQGAVGGVPTNNWQHVVSTFDGVNWNMYVNGILVGQSGDTVGAINFADAWHIGSGSVSGANRLFSGNISHVALYNHALTSGQVLTHYVMGIYGIDANTSVPIITLQPQPQSNFIGNSVTFSVSTLSIQPATNQWFKNNSPLNGQTNLTLTITNIQPGDATTYRVVVGNNNGTTNSDTVTLTLLSAGNSLRWLSADAGNNGSWDTGGSANWINIANSQQVVFNTADQVLFDDTVDAPLTVSVNGDVAPSVFTVNSANNNYTFSGSGRITGGGSMVKNGNSTLEMSTANDFTGSATILGGTVQMDEPLSGSATSLGAETGAPIIVTNGATLAVNASGAYPQGNSGLSTRQIVVSGSGVGGNGALRSVGNDIYHDGSPNGGLFRSLRLAGDATIGNSNGRWDLGQDGLLTVISTGGSNYNLTCLQGSYSEWHEVTIDTNLGNIDYVLTSGNTWAVEGMGSGLGNPTNVLTLHPNVNMAISHGNNNDDNGYAKIIHVESGSQFTYQVPGGAGDYFLKTSLQLDTGASMNFYNGNGGNNTGTHIGGTVTFNGLAHISIGDSTVTFTNIISGPGGFYWDSFNNLLTFAANNTYTGPSLIGSGLTLALTGNGAISQSSLIFFGGTDGTSVRLDASGRTDGTLTLANGQTLAGVGAITGNLTVSPGAVISPAGTNTTLQSTNLIGLVSASGNVTLSGTTIIKLNGSGSSDTVQAGGSITYGGTLNLANVNGTPLAAGDSFHIFSATGYFGSFTAGIVPTTPGPGLVWDTTQLSAGTINVVSGTSRPVLGGATVSGGNFVFSGSNGPAGSNYVVLTTTNIATPVANWTPVLTNMFDVNGAFHVTNAVNPAVGQSFFLLKVQ